jgi:hypothetical protein
MPLFFSRRFAKPGLALVALVVFALVLSACAIFKSGSLQVGQPAGIGSVRVHFALCTGGGSSEEGCHQNEESGQSQYMLGIAVPPGWSAPATVTAQPVGGSQPIVYTRNDEVTKALTEEPVSNPDNPWPPAGTQAFGYLSAVFNEESGVSRDWTVDIDLGLPAAADGGSSAPQFKALIATGWRRVDGSHPADRPIACFEIEPGPDSAAWCERDEEKEIGTSDLKIGASAVATPVFVGGRAPVSFSLDFASTAAAIPVFALAATTTVPGGVTTLVTGAGFTPGPTAGDSHRSPAASSEVMVAIPKNVKPGTYDVTLTATTPQGGAVSQVAKLQVTKPKLKLGGVKLNKGKGTATLSVTVPSAGTLTASGKGLVKTKKNAKKAKTLKLTIKAKGKTKAQLEELGKAKVKAKISFKPTSGIVVKKTKGITLKQS